MVISVGAGPRLPVDATRRRSRFLPWLRAALVPAAPALLVLFVLCVARELMVVSIVSHARCVSSRCLRHGVMMVDEARAYGMSGWIGEDNQGDGELLRTVSKWLPLCPLPLRTQ